MAKAACRACGTQNIFNIKLRDHPEEAKRLLDKLFQVAEVKLSLEENVVICARCAYKIEDTDTWLCNVHRYQAQRQARSNPNAFVRPKLLRETFVQENIWEENLTYNFSFEEDEDEEIPNAQEYVSSHVEPSNGQHRKNDSYKTNFEQRALCHAPVEKLSVPFSFLPSWDKNVHEKEYTEKPKDKVQNFDEVLSYNFDIYTQPKEELLMNGVAYTDRQNNAKAKNVSYSNFEAEKKDMPIKNFNFNGWNLSRSVRKEKSSIIEQKYPCYLRGQQQKEIPYYNEIQKRKGRPGVPLRGHESSDMFASQDSTTPRDMNAINCELSPDEDLIQRVRANIRKQDF